MGLKDLFKKKEPEMDIDASLGLDTNNDFHSGLGQDFGNPMMNQHDSGMGRDLGAGFHDQMQPSVNLSSQQFQQSSQPSMSAGGNDLQKDIQILSLKLDAIKSELDSMNQRIKNIETIAEKEQVQQPRKWY